MSPTLRALQTMTRTIPRTSTQTLLRSRQATQNFSILTRARQLARSFEPHPFGRISVQEAAPADYGRLVRRVGDAAKFYFPIMGLFLTWPIITEKVLLDGRM